MESPREPLKEVVQKLGVCKQMSDVLFTIFPDNEFAKYFDLFNDAINRPNSLQPFISELKEQLNTGAFSHTTSAINRFLAMDSFEVFTRDYVRRCCDMVEYITKRKVAGRLRLELEIEKQPLGRIIGVFKKASLPESSLASFRLKGILGFNRFGSSFKKKSSAL